MTDLEAQLVALANHRAQHIPERSPAEPEEEPDEVHVRIDWRRLALRGGRHLAATSAVVALAVLAVAITINAVRQNDPATLRASAVDFGMNGRDLVPRSDWARPLTDSGQAGTFALARVGVGFDSIQVAVPERATELFSPASTFNILNALIILETGVLSDVDTVVPWDGVQRELEAWNQDHSLRSGMEASAVWLFQQLAREVGEEAMAELVSAAEYGNAETWDAVDTFWLQGDFRTSAIDQLDFLERLALEELPFDSAHQAAVRDILVVEEGPGWTVRYNTGTGLRPAPGVGWLVGIVDNAEAQWVFAYNFDLPATADELGGLLLSTRDRLDLVIELLESAGVIGS